MKKPKHEPVRSLKELAQLFGVTSHSLAALIDKDPNAPKPSIARGEYGPGRENFCETTKSRHNYYVLSEMTAWWAKKQKGN